MSEHREPRGGELLGIGAALAISQLDPGNELVRFFTEESGGGFFFACCTIHLVIHPGIS